MDRPTLEMWHDQCDDPKTRMLIEQLLETYNQLDAARSQKSAAVKASAGLLRDIKTKDEHIELLVNAYQEQEQAISSSVDSFRKIYEMSVYGNELFQSEPLLRVWILAERFVSAKSNAEMTDRSIELMAALETLSENKKLVDMRNNMITFDDFMRLSQNDGVSDTTGDNEVCIEESDGSDS